jgi:homoserine O-acetyltransferase/O-succinyltransferase
MRWCFVARATVRDVARIARVVIVVVVTDAAPTPHIVIVVKTIGVEEWRRNCRSIPHIASRARLAAAVAHRTRERTSMASTSAAMPDDHMGDVATGLPPGATSRVLRAPIALESGDDMTDVTVAYTMYGEMNAEKTNIVLVGHSLTSNSNVREWWGEVVGDGEAFALDLERDCVVCVNYLGSPYGTASPVSVDPRKSDGGQYGVDFPTPVTIRDNAVMCKMLLEELGARGVKCAIGGSMGSMLALEFAVTYPDFVEELVIIAGCGRHTDWAIGIGEAQRYAIMSDSKYNGGAYASGDGPNAGLATSRMMAMLSYRAPASVDGRFSRSDMGDVVRPAEEPELGVRAHSGQTKLPYFAVESYLQYQGKKFIRRFDANCYIQLTYSLDSHDVSRGRGDYFDVLASIKQKTLVVGILSDVLYPYALQRELADAVPNAQLYTIDSPHGHDSFLIEIAQLNDVIARWRRGENVDTRKTTSHFTDLETSDDVEALREGIKRLREDLTVAESKCERAEAALAAALSSNTIAPGVRRSASSTGSLHGLVMPMNPGFNFKRLTPVFGKLSVDDARESPALGIGGF